MQSIEFVRVLMPPVMPVAHAQRVLARTPTPLGEQYFCLGFAPSEPRFVARIYFHLKSRQIIGLFRFSPRSHSVEKDVVDEGALILATEVCQGLLGMSLNKSFCVLRHCSVRLHRLLQSSSPGASFPALIVRARLDEASLSLDFSTNAIARKVFTRCEAFESPCGSNWPATLAMDLRRWLDYDSSSAFAQIASSSGLVMAVPSNLDAGFDSYTSLWNACIAAASWPEADQPTLRIGDLAEPQWSTLAPDLLANASRVWTPRPRGFDFSKSGSMQLILLATSKPSNSILGLVLFSSHARGRPYDSIHAHGGAIMASFAVFLEEAICGALGSATRLESIAVSFDAPVPFGPTPHKLDVVSLSERGDIFEARCTMSDILSGKSLCTCQAQLRVVLVRARLG